jgi:hypothetical protein
MSDLFLICLHNNIREEDMKKYIIILILILIGAVAYLSYQNKQLTTKYETSIENVKAYDAQLSGLEGDNRVLKLTVEQLNYFNDSIIKKMKVVQKELGIKDKRLQQLQYEASHAQRNDTITLTDTIFRNDFSLDTIVGDKWFKTNLHLKFPSTIALSPEIELERYTFINGKRETVNPPKKFFLFRWFQKKHTVVEVNVREMNPYVKNKTQRFIQIIE